MQTNSRARIPRPNADDRRSLPSLIALPVSVPGTALQSRRGGRYRPNPGDIHKQSIVLAMDSLVAVTGLCLSFMAHISAKDVSPGPGRRRSGPPPTDVEAAKRWILELNDSLDMLEEALSEGCLDRNVTIDTEGVSALSETLDQVPDFEDPGPGDAEICVHNMLSYWLEEISRRGWELFNICIMSVDCRQALKDFSTMNEMRYPVR